tara:strand:- start:1656 stop:2483 length:828 start_codon:yes stop_codon:yes gene_type:complete
MSVCNENRINCKPDEVLAATAIPACGKFVNPSNLQAEQLVYDQAFNDLINNYGIPIDYYINTFNLSAADLLYGTDWGDTIGLSDDTSFGEFKGALQMQMYVELSDDALQLSKFGFDPGDEFTGFLHISTFHTAASAYFNYSEVGQSIEPKAGDVISLQVLGCDRPNGRGTVMYQITERMEQDMSALNPILGHYVYRLRGKRFDYSFQSGLCSEPVNEQIYDNSFSGILSTTLYDQVSSDSKTYPNPDDPYNIDNVSKTKVMDMDINDTDIYGSYY